VKPKKIVSIVLLLFVAASIVYLAISEMPAQDQDSTEPMEANFAHTTEGEIVDSLGPGRHVVAFYFHGQKRCATCEKLETYAVEAIVNGFAEELAAGRLVWRVVNYEEPQSKPYVEDYALAFQSVVLVEVVDGHQMSFKKLDRIWDLVNDKPTYISYMTEEVRNFLENY